MRLQFSTIAIVFALAVSGTAQAQIEQLKLTNEILSAYTSKDLTTVISKVEGLTDPGIRQLWYGNILLLAMEQKKCQIGRPFIEKLNDPNIKKLWSLNYKNQC